MAGAIASGQIAEYMGRRGAIQCLKKKKLYEQELEKLGNFKLRIHEQMMLLEGAEIIFETVAALRAGASTTTATLKKVKITDIEKTMTEINEEAEKMRQIQEIISTSIGAAADFDEDELEVELEELEDADSKEADVLQPVSKTPVTLARATPAGKQSSRKPNLLFPSATSTAGKRVWVMTHNLDLCCLVHLPLSGSLFPLHGKTS